MENLKKLAAVSAMALAVIILANVSENNYHKSVSETEEIAVNIGAEALGQDSADSMQDDIQKLLLKNYANIDESKHVENG